MIRPLRRRHGAAFVVIAPALLAGLFVALQARAPLPTVAAFPDPLDERLSAETLKRVTWARTGPLWKELGIEIARVPSPGGTPRLALRPTRDLGAPEALVYWAPGVPGVEENALPGNAMLLGALAGTRVFVTDALPEMRYRNGRFLIYSLSHDRVLATGATSASASPPPG